MGPSTHTRRSCSPGCSLISIGHQRWTSVGWWLQFSLVPSPGPYSMGYGWAAWKVLIILSFGLVPRNNGQLPMGLEWWGLRTRDYLSDSGLPSEIEEAEVCNFTTAVIRKKEPLANHNPPRSQMLCRLYVCLTSKPNNNNKPQLWGPSAGSPKAAGSKPTPSSKVSRHFAEAVSLLGII